LVEVLEGGRGIHREDAKGAKEWKRGFTAKTRRARRKRRIGRGSGRGIAPLRREGLEGRQGARVSGRLWILRDFAVGIGTIE